MKRHCLALVLLVAVLAYMLGTSCSRKTELAVAPKPTAFGAAIVESSGGKQFAQTGTPSASTSRRPGQRRPGNCRRRSARRIRTRPPA